jgi:hypothetical protein
MKMLKVHVTIFAGSAAAGLVLSLPANADALSYYRRLNATACAVVPGGGGVYTPVLGTVQNNGTTTSTLSLDCPYIDDTSAPKQSLDGLYVDVSNNNSSPTSEYPLAYACVVNFTDVGSACGSESRGKVAGWNSLSLDLTAWRNSSYSGYYPSVQVGLGGSSAMVGYLAN